MARYLAFGAAAVLLLVAVALLMVPTRYTAFALLRVADRPPGVLDKSPSPPESYAIFKRTQQQMFHSGPVLRSTVREPEIRELSVIKEHDEDPVSWLNDQLIVDYPDDAEIMRVAIETKVPSEGIKIVNKLVEKYLIEAVQNERDRRVRHEGRLEDKLNEFSVEFSKQVEALHMQEKVSKVASTEAARVKKRIHEESLTEEILRRNTILRDLHATELQIIVKRALNEIPSESRTADPPAEDAADGKAKASDDLPLSVLEKKQTYLEEQLKIADQAIQAEAKAFDDIESISGSVTAKQQELLAMQKIMNDLRTELDRVRVERLAQERITKLDDAQLDSSAGDGTRRHVGAALALIASLSLFAVGMLLGRRHKPAANE